MKRFADRYTFRFDAPPEAVWRAVSDTDAVSPGTHAQLPAS